MTHSRLLVLGSGPAGCTAALYAARAGLEPTLITGISRGGQLTTTTGVDNWPGGADGLQGPALMESMLAQLERLAVPLINDQIESVDLSKKPFTFKGSDSYSCDALVIATGATAKYLGLPTEQQYLGRGVSACATCDGFFYRGLPVAVVGGGNTAVEEALYLSSIASQVTLVHRRDELRAEHALVQQLMKAVEEGKVSLCYDHVLAEVLGDDSGVNGAMVKHVSSGELKKLEVSGVFIAIGHTPNTGIFESQLDMAGGYIDVGSNSYATSTSVPGVFAAGDVSDPIYRQAITSAGSGCMAALDAGGWLASNSSK